MASTKREFPKEEEHEAKKAKIVDATDSPKSTAKQRVVLNPADCDLDFNIKDIGLQGSALYEEGFAYCWSGSRATVGITGGKYCFGCKVISVQPVNMEDTSPDQQHVCRLGISRGDDPVGILGETVHSFGFGGTGKFSNSRNFFDYGETFGIGDTIVCAVNLENKPLASIGFSKNGKWLGTAKHFDAGPRGMGVVDSPKRKLQWESALFPHILLKNVVVQMQFSVDEGLVLEEGYKPWASAHEDGNAIMGPAFTDQRECEVIMMVGLPASGKTTWAEKRVKECPEKRYVLLGTNLVLDQMKVPGLLRKHNYGERFDRLMDRATGIFNTLLSRAANIPRNYIIDQTNVYKNARKRKLKPFAFFQKIAVLVFPPPEELQRRSDKRFKEMGKEVPADVVNSMLANYVLPTSKDMPDADEYFDQVIFAELDRIEAQRYLDEMKLTLASASTNNCTPHCCESSFSSRSLPSPQNQEALPFTVGRGPCPCSYSPHPPSANNFQLSNQVHTSYPGAGLPGSSRSFSEAYQGTMDPALPNAGATSGTTYYSPMHGNYPPYHSYSVGNMHIRPNFEGKNTIPGRFTDPYGSSITESSPVVNTRMTSFGYDHSIGYFSGIGPRDDLQGPRVSALFPRPCPSADGPPYGNLPPGPSYGSPPSKFPPYSGGYPPPRPGHY